MAAISGAPEPKRMTRAVIWTTASSDPTDRGCQSRGYTLPSAPPRREGKLGGA